MDKQQFHTRGRIRVRGQLSDRICGATHKQTTHSQNGNEWADLFSHR